MNTHQRLFEGLRIRTSFRIAVLGIVAVALLVLSILLPGLTARADAAVSYRATNSYIGGTGPLTVRTTPDRTSAVAYSVRSGRRISIDCQLVGGRLGFSRYAGNRTWNRLSDGRYIHDVVTTTPGGVTSENVTGGGYVVWSAGIPRCTSGAPTTSPAPVASSTPASTPTPVTTSTPAPTTSSAPTPTTAPPASAPAGTTGYTTVTSISGGGDKVNVRRSPSTSGAIAYTLPLGGAVTIDCQLRGDRLGFSQYAENRTWNRLTDGNYVHDGLTTTPGGIREDLTDGGYAYWSRDIARCSPQEDAPVTQPVAAYPDDDAQDCSARFGKYSWCKNGTDMSVRRFAYRNCTDYVAWRLNIAWTDASDRTTSSANAIEWRQGWLQRGKTVSDVPRVGAVAWWGTSRSSFGHVAVVTAVNADGSVQVAQYNRNGDGRYSEETTRADKYLY